MCQVVVCCCNCPAWYRVMEYTYWNESRSDCINAFVYGINDSSVIQRKRRIYYTAFFLIGYAVPLTVICVLYVRSSVSSTSSHLCPLHPVICVLYIQSSVSST